MQKDRNTVIEITSATKLPKEIIEKVRNAFGQDLRVEETIEKEVLGGVNIRVGGKMYIMTFSSRFDTLRRALKSARSESESEKLVETLKHALESVDFKPKFEEVGIVKSVQDGVVKLSGLPHCQSFEQLEFENGETGLALNLEKEFVGGVVLGDFRGIKEGVIVRGTGKVVSFAVGDDLLGRVVNPLGSALDGKGPLKAKKQFPVERIAPGVMGRKEVNTPLQTGVKAIDSVIPIGRGQRELILGDRQTGKSTLLTQTILNQKDADVLCIYVSIGEKLSKLKRLVSTLESQGAMEYTSVVHAGASDPAPLLYLAPYAATALAEFYAQQGKDVLIIYNNLSNHANAYREMSLLLRRPSGREAFPGDIFYLHSRLLERAGNFNENAGGGSITALPVIETQANDISAYIPTNVISITDGQIFLEPDLFHRGIRPAINVGASVSRVGGNAQIKPMKKVAGKLKLTLAQYRDIEAFTQFASDLDVETKKQIDKGRRIIEIFKQGADETIPVAEQVALIYAVDNGYFDAVPVEDMKDCEARFLQEMRALDQNLLETVAAGIWDENVELKLREACMRFANAIKNSIDPEVEISDSEGNVSDTEALESEVHTSEL